MKHLSADELVDFIEGALAERRAAHVATCDRCRRQADDLRAVLAEAREVEAPEPSPLFWDHFSARVHGAVAGEPEPRSFPRWLWRPAHGLVVSLALVLIVVTAALWRPAPGPVPAPQMAMGSSGGDPFEPPADFDAVPGDETWEMVVAVASSLAWDEAEEAGFAVRPGAADRAVFTLTAEERSELARLLEAELPPTKS